MVSERANEVGEAGVVERGGIGDRAQLASLLFEPGTRPDCAALSALAANGGFSIALAAGDWAELLRDGLTFDVAGLAPGEAAAPTLTSHRYGLVPGFAPDRLEALALMPGPHLAGAAHLLPVVRVATALLLALAELPGLAALSWCPAANLLSPEWFGKAVGGWLGGGPFPAFALVALALGQKGAIGSEGLTFLTGQEFVLEPAAGKEPVLPLMSIAVRLLDWLVAHGRIATAREVVLTGAGTIDLDVLPGGTLSARCR